MILSINGIIAGNGNNCGYADADVCAFITAASITDTTQKSAVNQLVLDLKSANIWTKMKAIYPFVGGTASSHKFNLKDPRDLDAAYRLAFSGGWTHSSTGALPNGTTAYADTKLVPSVMAQNSVHASVYLRTDIDGLYFDIYGENASSGLGFLSKYSSRKYVYTNTLSSDNAIDFTASTGLYIGNRTSSTNNVLFRNTSKLVNGTRASLTPNSTQPIYLGAANYSGTVGAYSPREQAFASIGDGLTDAEAANFYTAVQTFQTTLERHVGVPIVADSDAQAFLNAAVITDTTQANAINTLVSDLKSANIWTKMKAIYPFVGGTASQHRFNLKDPRDLDVAFRLQFYGGGTHSANGYQPDGATAYADTYLVPSTVLNPSNFTHLSYYSNSDTQKSFEYVMGSNDATNTLALISRRNTNLQFFMSTNNTATYVIASNTSATTGAGFLLGTQLASTIKLLRQNVLQASNTTTSSGAGLSTRKVFIGANNDNNTPNNYTDKLCSFSSIGDGLSDSEATAFYNAVQTFNTTLSRQV